MITLVAALLDVKYQLALGGTYILTAIQDLAICFLIDRLFKGN